MRDEEALGLFIGLIGGAVLAYIIINALTEKVPCPVCREPLRRGVGQCPACGVGLRWG